MGQLRRLCIRTNILHFNKVSEEPKGTSFPPPPMLPHIPVSFFVTIDKQMQLDHSESLEGFVTLYFSFLEQIAMTQKQESNL